MNFLNPIVLFGLVAAVLPLIIHILSKRRAKEVAFPSIKLLKIMQTDRIRMLKLKQLIMLILRTLIIIMVVLAFARPTLRSVSKENARTSAVIIIDGSASMMYIDNGELLFDRALRKGEEIIDLLRKNDTASIIFSGKIPTVLGRGLTGDKKHLLNVLKSCENSLAQGDPTRAFEMALNILDNSGALNKEIFYLTDGAVNTLPDSLDKIANNIRLYTVIIGPEERDGSVIEDISLVNKILVPGHKITFKVKGHLGTNEREMDIEFFVNGERKGRSKLNKRSADYLEADFSYTPETPGWYSVYAKVNEGYFEPGEKRRKTIQVPRKVKILLAGGLPGDIYFIERVLNPDPDNPMFSIKNVLQTDITRSDITMADVIILSGVTSLPVPVYRSLLSAVMENGKGLMIFPAKDINSALYNDGIFRDIIPLKVEKRVTFEGQNTENYSLINWFDFTHPILSGVSQEGNFQRPEVKSYLKMIPSVNTSILARFSDNSMAAGEIACGKGRAMVFAVNAFQDSDLPLTGIFVPFVIRSVQYLSSIIINSGSYDAGEVINENIGDVPQDSQVTVKPEDRPAQLVDVEFTGRSLKIKDLTAGAPGFYSIYAGDKEKMRYSVNAPVSEIVFKRYGPIVATEAYNKISWKEIDSSSDLVEFVLNDRYGKELSGLFVLCAIALLCVEMVIARKV
ncbi:MAG TPA: VWA domain-containing protein [bacterium]|nr:VWA domain-containing protein [bacterium]